MSAKSTRVESVGVSVWFMAGEGERERTGNQDDRRDIRKWKALWSAF
jgi:hypothetical protein